jgi:phosphatidylglycerol:prolipoprotein diacylglycerol transferase
VKTAPGRISGEFLIAYAVLRAIGETFREPDAALILGLSRGTFYSLFLIAGGCALSAISGRRSQEDQP